jgi:hypothetical protein
MNLEFRAVVFKTKLGTLSYQNLVLYKVTNYFLKQ